MGENPPGKGNSKALRPMEGRGKSNRRCTSSRDAWKCSATQITLKTLALPVRESHWKAGTARWYDLTYIFCKSHFHYYIKNIPKGRECERSS